MIYSKISKFYDFLIAPTKRGIDSFIKRANINMPEKPIILDAGCGTGVAAFSLLKKYPKATIYAFDINQDMINIFIKNRNRKKISPQKIKINQGDLNNIDKLYQKFFFDLVIISGSLEYASLQPTIKKISRIIKRGGIFINLAVKRGWFGNILQKIYTFKYQSVENIVSSLKTNGFFDIKVENLTRKDFPANLSRIAIIARKK